MSARTAAVRQLMVRRELAPEAVDSGERGGEGLEAAHHCGNTADAVWASETASPMVCGRGSERSSDARRRAMEGRSIVVSQGVTSWSDGCCNGHRSRASVISTLAEREGLRNSGKKRAMVDGQSSMDGGDYKSKRISRVEKGGQSVYSHARPAMPPWPTG